MRVTARPRRRSRNPWTDSEGSESGATATEYGILVFFIALVIVGGVMAFGANLNTLYGNLAQWLNDTL